MEWRFPGAAEAPVRITRGRLGSHSESPSPELLRLEARIAEQSAAHPNNPYWIMLNGRLNLLLWKYDAALQDFKRALDLRPDSASALTDLAGAYFERADATGRDSDYGTAIELLTTALQKQPHEPVALFNRGLAEERMYLYRRAAADWEELLKVEPAGGWANEARARLAEAKKKPAAPEHCA
jgi:cytochrome c-type biogenesis protein CcmH/NrfG